MSGLIRGLTDAVRSSPRCARVSAGPRAASPAGERGTTRCWQRQRKYLKADSVEGIGAVISRQHYPKSITNARAGKQGAVRTGRPLSVVCPGQYGL